MSTWRDHYAVLVGRSLPEDVAAAMEADVRDLLGFDVSKEDMADALRSLARTRDWTHRGPTAVDVADAIGASRKRSAPALPHSSRCDACQGMGVADWLWPWSRPLVGKSGAVVRYHYCPPQPCLCALGEFKRREMCPDALAAGVNRDMVRRLLDAADSDGCPTALARLARAEAMASTRRAGE